MSTRVLVVDDSILFRTKLQLGLAADSEITVVACAADPAGAMEVIDKQPIDVMVLDVEMPGMSGIQFLKQLLPRYPIPAVVISSLPGNALDALTAGAVDFVCKPQAAKPNAQNEFIEELIEKVKIASVAKTRVQAAPKASLLSKLPTRSLEGNNLVVAIGASTGGTEAIIEVVKNLPESFPGIIIVQHMPANFTTLYAQRLDRICQMKAKEAQDMDRVLPGQIIVAAGEFHLTLKKDAAGYYIRSQRGDKVSGHCPSVDVMFHSVAEAAGKNAVGVILTGMGADGAKGITKLRQSGGYTIGQDKESCVVYGMPMEAYKLGGIARQLSLDQIGAELIYYVRTHKK